MEVGVVVRTLYVSERSLYSMRSVILSQWRERRMAGVIWQDFGALTTVRARQFWTSESAGDGVIETLGSILETIDYSNRVWSEW